MELEVVPGDADDPPVPAPVLLQVLAVAGCLSLLISLGLGAVLARSRRGGPRQGPAPASPAPTGPALLRSGDLVTPDVLGTAAPLHDRPGGPAR